MGSIETPLAAQTSTSALELGHAGALASMERAPAPAAPMLRLPSPPPQPLGGVLFTPRRRPVRASPGWPEPTVAWPNTNKPPAPTGDFSEIMDVVSPVDPNTGGRDMPVVSDLSAPVGRCLMRLQPSAVARYVAWFRREPRPASDFVRWAAARGIPFDLGREGNPGMPQDGGEDWEIPTSLSFSEYVQSLVHLPAHIMACFFREGGIGWRLCIEFMPRSIIREALRGPSAHAVAPLPSEHPWPAGIVVERPTVKHYAILTGRCLDGSSWFPHPEVFATVAPGEWTTWLEAWFAARIRDCTHNNHTRLSDSKWASLIRKAMPAVLRRTQANADPRLTPALLALAGYPNVEFTLPVQAEALPGDESLAVDDPMQVDGPVDEDDPMLG